MRLPGLAKKEEQDMADRIEITLTNNKWGNVVMADSGRHPIWGVPGRVNALPKSRKLDPTTFVVRPLTPMKEGERLVVYVVSSGNKEAEYVVYDHQLNEIDRMTVSTAQRLRDDKS